jgi:hypothetical protein
MEKEITLFFNSGAYAYFIAQFCISAGLGGLGALAAGILTKRRPTAAAYKQWTKEATTEEKRKEKREELDAFYKSLVNSCLVLAFSVIAVLAHSGSIITGFTGAADFFSAEGAVAAGITMSNRVADSFGNLHSILYLPVLLILLHIPILRFAMALLFRHTMVSSIINAALGLGFAVVAFLVYLNPYALQMIELVIVLTGIFLFQNIYTGWYARFMTWAGLLCMGLMIVLELATGVLVLVCGNYFYLFSAGHLCYILGPMSVVMTAALLVFAIMLGNKFLPKNMGAPAS